jgi:preprotein translocase subunit SecA
LKPLIVFHTVSESVDSWNGKEIEESLAALSVSFPAQERVKALSQEARGVVDMRGKLFEEIETAVRQIVKAKEQEMGYESFAQGAQRLWLHVIDMLWMDHLEMLDSLRNSVRLRAYGQRDPLVEYKNEALKLFKEFNQHKDQLFVTNLLRSIASQHIQAAHVQKPQAENLPDQQAGYTLKTALGKIGRNDPCPCGSGKKYKKCHGQWG